MNRRRFIQQTTAGSLTISHAMMTISTSKTDLRTLPNLLCLWDFNPGNPYTATGKYSYQLQEAAGPVALVNEGILSGSSIDICEGQYLTIPRADCPALNIRGKTASVTVLAWVKRKPKSTGAWECEAVAGLWNETEKKRQYCLFLNIKLHGSSDQVCGHISGVGGPTPGEKWCVDVSLGQKPVLFDEWTFVAMTYDGQQIKSYRNGELDSRASRNPYSYPEGIFDGGPDGSDFTVGAVHRLGEMGNDFVGQLGGLAIFDRALTADEISRIHRQYPLPKPDRLSVLATGLNFPEGPAFASDGSLWAVELKGAGLVNLQNGIVKRYPVGGSPNGIAIDKSGKVWFCDSELNAIRCFDPTTGQTETKANAVAGEPLDKPNDLAFDRAGNLLFTCPGNSRQQPTGYVCVLTPDGSVRKITEGKYFPNGLALSADSKTLVLAETYKHRLWRGQWNPETTEWTEPNVWCNIGGPDGPGGPDGMAFGEDGNLYVAVYGTGSIRVVNRAGGVAHQIGLPGPNPTNCAFDPSGRLGLVITEAGNGQLISYKTSLKGILS